MPQIGWFELLLIVIVAILVIGPKDFPIVLRKIGNWVGTIKKYLSEMQSNLAEVTEIDLENIKTKNNKKKIDEEKR
jgi:sec-independent protein translocase protein TatB